MDFLDNIIITDVTETVTVASAKGRTAEIIDRSSYGLSFCTEGQITYTQNGKTYISDPGKAVILPKGKSYSIYGDKKGIFPVINFECTSPLPETITILPINNIQTFLHDYEQMKSLMLFSKNRTKIISILYGIIHRLSMSSGTETETLLPAIKYLENNYSDPMLTNKILAKQCAISEVYFRKLFHLQYNTTPKQYVMEIRTDKAKQLLTDGILKINVIAEMCGFSNSYHFCRVFRKRTGLTPTEYMKQNRIYKI
jgi:AraC-like DNA-binding protein